MSEPNIIDRMFAALAAGDIAAARACYTADALCWHSFDGVAHDLDAITDQWRDLVSGFPRRAFVDVRRQATATGFVQQHVMVGWTAAGVAKAWPCCIVVRVENGLIARLDEYIDRAGAFVPQGDAIVAPGLPEPA
ncbi:MAG: nuclear transport factor 2 family protein [Sphingomonadales bacterium]|nr:nuclear transport factor 2 family protein [Sphingomonadales bacterium]